MEQENHVPCWYLLDHCRRANHNPPVRTLKADTILAFHPKLPDFDEDRIDCLYVWDWLPWNVSQLIWLILSWYHKISRKILVYPELHQPWNNNDKWSCKLYMIIYIYTNFHQKNNRNKKKTTKFPSPKIHHPITTKNLPSCAWKRHCGLHLGRSPAMTRFVWRKISEGSLTGKSCMLEYLQN